MYAWIMTNTDEFAFVPIIYFFYPETSNISLEDIDKIFLKDDVSSERSSTIAGDDIAGPGAYDGDKIGEKHVESVWRTEYLITAGANTAMKIQFSRWKDIQNREEVSRTINIFVG